MTPASCAGIRDRGAALHQLLEIDDWLGNQAGLATSYAALANLMTERDIANQAVGYDLRGLAIRLQCATAGRWLLFSSISRESAHVSVA